MQIVVKMKVIMSPPGRILKESSLGLNARDRKPAHHLKAAGVRPHSYVAEGQGTRIMSAN